MPAAAAIIPAVISAGVSIAQMSQAKKQAARAKRDMEDYDRQTLDNPANSLQVSTLGADRAREDLARNVATVTSNAAQGGSRAIVGLVPQMIAQTNDNTQQIVANLDAQQKAIDQQRVQGDFAVQQMTEQRENNDLLGIGNQYAVAQQNRANGVNMLGQSIMGLTYAASNGVFDGNTALKSATNNSVLTPISVQPQGIITANNSIQAPVIPSSVNYANNQNPFLFNFKNRPI